MYVVQSPTRIYSAVLLFVCAALFPISSLANAPNQLAGYWSMEQSRWISEQEMEQRVQRELKRNIYKPSNSTLSTAPSAPTISKNATGGLSATSQSIIKNMGYPSTFSTTSNYSLGAAKSALKSCARSPVCAVRGFGTAGIIYAGIQGWMDVYGMIYDPQTDTFKEPYPYNPFPEPPPIYPNPEYTKKAVTGGYTIPRGNCYEKINTVPVVKCAIEGDSLRLWACDNTYMGRNFVGLEGDYCQYANAPRWESGVGQPAYKAVDPALVDQRIDQSYQPEPSDAPFVLLSGEPNSLTLSSPSSVNLPATTTSSTNSLGETETTVTNSTINYNVTNNNTSNPSINSTMVENTTVYNDYGTVINTSTTTTTSNGVQGETTSPIEFELPAFCDWASVVCDWLNWTKEPLDEEEPDLSTLISEFEPDEDVYSSGIGSGSCPAPMSLNLGIINQTVEVSYQPFCDFLAMIRPLVIAAAWLLSAFMYVGVLRRG